MTSTDKTQIQQTVSDLLQKLPNTAADLLLLTTQNESSLLNPALCMQELSSHLDILRKYPETSGLLLKLLLIFSPDDDQIIQLSTIDNFKPLPLELARTAAVRLAKIKDAKIYDILDFMMLQGRELDSLDCISLIDYNLVEKYLTEKNVDRMIKYLISCIQLTTNCEELDEKLNIFCQVLINKKFFILATKLSIETQNWSIMQSLYDQASEPEKLQIALILSTYQEFVFNHFTPLPQHLKILKNQHKHEFFSASLDHLNLTLPKSVNDVLKRDDIQIEWSKSQHYLADFLQNAFMNAGCKTDFMINSHLDFSQNNDQVNESQILTEKAENAVGNDQKQLPEAYNLLLKSNNGILETGKSDISTAMATASVGLLHLWSGYETGFEQILRLQNSTDKYVRAGALLAIGIAASGTRPEGFDYVYKLLAPQFTPFDANNTEESLQNHRNSCQLNAKFHEKLSKNDLTLEWANCKEALAVFGLGMAYYGQNHQISKDIIMKRLRQSSSEITDSIPCLEKNPRSFACLALGMISLSTCDVAAANCILRLIAGNSRSQRLLRFFPLCCISLGLIFFQAAKTPEKALICDDFVKNILETLQSVKKPDQQNEHMAVTAVEDNKQLAAYLQSLITIFAYAGQNDPRILQQTMTAFSSVLLGRVAAEEAIEIIKYDKSAQFKKNKNKEDISSITAESGQPLMLPTSDRLIWPGDNLDPMTVLAIGISAISLQKNPEFLLRFSQRILQFCDIHAKRAVPFALALGFASNPDKKVVNSLEKLVNNSDKTLSGNAILALGIVGCGSQNQQICGILRHAIESKFYQENNIENVLINTQIAFGLLFAGRGSLCINLSRPKSLSAMLALMSFAAPAASVMARPKCTMAYFLLSLCLESKIVQTVNEKMEVQKVQARVGRLVEDFGSAKGVKLVGFSLHDTPVVKCVEQNMRIVSEGVKGLDEECDVVVVVDGEGEGDEIEELDLYS